MRNFTMRFFAVCLCLFAGLACRAASASAQNCDTAKPWTWWWIFGNSATCADITWQLEHFKRVGIGGVCIIPVYGERGDGQNYVKLFSPEFMQNLSFISDECKRLGLGLDMTMGSGWPFGGGWIDAAHSSKKMSPDFTAVPTGFKVKRAAPGGEGFAIDPFSPESCAIHSGVVKDAFAPFAKKRLLRAFFNDSYEFYDANFTDNFFEKFAELRGYDLRPFAPELFSRSAAAPQKQGLSDDARARLWQDYHETIADLLYFGMTKSFVETSHSLGFKSVNQAHGSPANIIDLYAAADIPETESFGASEFSIPELAPDPEYPAAQFGRPNREMFRFAASAAHLTGKKLVASESCTWLANHFRVSLRQIKPELDKLWTGGINHVFYHGTPYTPRSKPFPGRLFYASTNFSHTSHFAEFYPELNAYVRRVQEILQSSAPDNDLLVYFPIREFWRGSGGAKHVLFFDVHKADFWLDRAPKFKKLLRELNGGGYCYDFVSDRLLENLRVEDGVIKSGNSQYRALLVPECSGLPISTFAQLKRLADSGAKIVFQNAVASDVSGYGNIETRRAELRKLAPQTWRDKYANVKAGADFCALLDAFSVRAEKSLAAQKLDFMRLRRDGTAVYFVANQNEKFGAGTISFASENKYVEIYDPLRNARYAPPPAAPAPRANSAEIRLRSGESAFAFVLPEPSKATLRAVPQQADCVKIGGVWKVEFLKPFLPEAEIPEPIKTSELKSWTEFSAAAASFSGVARYTTTFEVADPNAAYALHLNGVRDAAKVRVNGGDIGSAWCVPFVLEIPLGVLKRENTLEIDVYSNSLNAVRELARRDKNWNYGNRIVDITYRPYDAASKPHEPSGLLQQPTLVKYKD